MTAYLLGLATIPALVTAGVVVAHLSRWVSGARFSVIRVGRLALVRGGWGAFALRFTARGFVRDDTSLSLGTTRTKLMWLAAPSDSPFDARRV